MFRPKLKAGGRVALVATSGPVDRERAIKASLAVEEMGYEPVLGKNALARHGYLAGSDEKRAADINESFADHSVDGIFCLRGGYGAQRIIHLLDKRTIALNPKVFAGYSDITALLAVFNGLGFAAFHAPMVATQFYKVVDDFTMDSFKKALSGAPQGDTDVESVAGGECAGALTGGNLSLIASSIGTPYEIDTAGKILFIEEIGEEPYKIDRMLNQLKRSGKLGKCAGVAFGAFTDCEPKETGGLSIGEVILDAVGGLGIPAVKGVGCGHVLPTLTLAMGCEAKIKDGGLWLP